MADLQNMAQHINIETDESSVPYYATYNDELIAGFFGAFRFLSNFYPVPSGIFFEDLCYPSVENAYQCYKYPASHRAQFIDISPGAAKKLGRIAPGFNQKKWDKNKVALMSALCRQKFTNNPKLKEMLLLTDGCQLEERNNWNDLCWGCNEKGEGENHLGKILMTIRHDLTSKKEMW